MQWPVYRIFLHDKNSARKYQLFGMKMMNFQKNTLSNILNIKKTDGKLNILFV